MPSYDEAAQEAEEDYSDEALIALLAFFGAFAISEVLTETQAAWATAFDQGLIQQSLEEFLAGSGLPVGDLGDLGELANEIRDEMAVEAHVMLRDFRRSFKRESETLVAKAAMEGWSKAKYLDEMDKLAVRMGANFEGSMVANWLRNGIRKVVNRKQLETAQKEPMRRLFPYQIVITRRDGRVRPNHSEMDGFVAYTMWSGWPSASPLYGYGCRCVLRSISWQTAKSAGMVGQFPYGLGQLQAWSGPDAGYSK